MKRYGLGQSALVLCLSGCATTTTTLAPVTPAEVAEEEEAQRALVLAELNRAQQRLDDLSFDLMNAASPLCADKTAPRLGIRFQSHSDFSGPWIAAAQSSLSLTDTLTITSVARGSPAHQAGLEWGDRLLEINGITIPIGKGAAEAFSRLLVEQGMAGAALLVRRGGDPVLVEVEPTIVCGFGNIVIVEGDINAFADGENVIVPWAMMRFATDDELRAVLAHEIAHNAMGHIEAKRSNAMLAGFFGLLADVALATQGVNSGGENTANFMAAGASAFSQDFEREADYVGMYVLARAGKALETAPNLWRQFAQINPTAISYASTHPTTAERFVRLRKAIEEIERKRAKGLELLPEMKSAGRQ